MKPPLDLRLYAIIDVGADGRTVAAERIEAAMAAGVTLLQVRGKLAAPRVLWRAAGEIVRRAHRRHIAVLVNDRADIAAAVGADGVHLGQSDLPATAVRRLWPELRVGLSVHDEAELLGAEAAGAAYVASGSLYPTGSKADATPLDHERFRALAESTRLPVVGIGGITAARAPAVAALGAAGVAVISGLWDAADIEAAAHAYRLAFP